MAISSKLGAECNIRGSQPDESPSNDIKPSDGVHIRRPSGIFCGMLYKSVAWNFSHYYGSDMSNSEIVQSTLERIKKYKTKESLTHVYTNISRYQSITEYERELLIDAIASRLREIAPAVATRLFGPKDSDAEEFLQKTWKILTDDFDLTGNRVGNGAKIGGSMINGEKFIDRYISYRNDEGINAGLSWLQDDPDTNRYLTVTVREVGKNRAGLTASHRFEAGQEDDAVACYRSELAKLIG